MTAIDLVITADGRPEWQVRREMEQKIKPWLKRRRPVWRMRRLRRWRAEQDWKHHAA